MPSLRVATDHRTIRLLDGAVGFWVALWCVLGVATGVTLWQAADVGDTISASGRSLSAVGESLETLADLPVVGERPGEIGADVRETAVDITARGSLVKGQLRLLGVLLGISVVGIPVTPILGLYLPLRLRRRREVASLRTQLREHGDDPRFERYLADRARAWLPYADVARIDPDGTAGPDAERRLADAELGRLGISRRRPTAPATG